MTNRKSFCINKVAPPSMGIPDNMIKPFIIGDIVHDKLTKKNRYRIVKMDNNIKLEINTISIWDWDDDSKNYKDNFEITDEFKFFEMLEFNISSKSGTDAKLQDTFRSEIKKGIPLTIQISNVDGIFFVLKKTINGSFGVYLTKNQFIYEKGRIKLSVKSDDADNAYAEYAYVSEDNTVDNGMTMNQSRSYSLVDSMEVIRRFPLIDVVSLAIKAVGNYLTSFDNSLSFKLTEPQIKELIEASNIDLSEYVEATDSGIKTILEDPGVMKSLYQAINKLTPESIEVEKFLLRNEDFKTICMDSVHETILNQKNSEIEELDNEIINLNKEKINLNDEINNLHDIIQKLDDERKKTEQLTSEIDALIQKRKYLEEALNDEKDQFLRSLIVNSVALNNTSSNPASISSFTYPQVFDYEKCMDENILLKNLKGNLSKCLKSDISLGMLSHYIVSALKLNMAIIVCNDPFDIVSNCISASLDGRLCSYVDVSGVDINSIRPIIDDNPNQVLRIEGCLEDFNYRKYFSVVRHSRSHLIFLCNDKAILDAAPPEVWNHSVIVDLNNMEVSTRTISKYSIFELISSLEAEDEDEWSSSEKLLGAGAITLLQYSILNHLASLIGQPDNDFIKLQARQMAVSNQKTDEFQKVMGNE